MRMKSDTWQGSLQYGDARIAYVVRRQPARIARRVAIHVEPDGRVLVDAPEGASEPDIRAAVRAKARWIHAHVVAARERMAQVLAREYVSGESWLYLGRRYRLKVLVKPDKTPSVRLSGTYLEVTVSARSAATVRKVLEAWYRERARKVLIARLDSVAASLRWVRTAPPVRFQAMKVQWGSCSPAGRLTLNPHLVKASRQCIDYVLLHELCHLKEHNHSAKFYDTVERHLPNWRRIKDQLDRLSEVILSR
jgi:predicted metal-dependent hydrolase